MTIQETLLLNMPLPDCLYRMAIRAQLKQRLTNAVQAYGNETLDDAEDAMLELTCERANLSDGQDILELGCGWGSLTLYMAKKYPNTTITAVSNAQSQRQYIEQRLVDENLTNVNVITENVATLTRSETYDRIISIEMMEHMRNYDVLFKTLSGWLKSDGNLFIHIFGHRNKPYTFDDDTSWMASYFLTLILHYVLIKYGKFQGLIMR